jgi:hypothetical protein
MVRTKLGHRDEAIRLQRQVVALNGRLRGPDHAETVRARRLLDSLSTAGMKQAGR